ncbi:putative zinc finger protein [Paenibacillus taihuensis]|uniref:Anti-sigma-W factor RsiW n=1 Tax=Paenibacillus taihuensis TaxID=1156355 RepID=A0A3D9SEK9_9BACL|nr:zf-HC2 domain-containing protein [Paenibacillus taihuensis]REE94346.1 putative zinc finger protein [Paenibacillus taihuensis]
MHNHPEEQLSAYLDDELEEVERQQVEAHLETCESCQAIVDDLLGLKHEFRLTFAAVEAPMNLENRVLLTLREEETPQKSVRYWLAAILIAMLPLASLYLFAGPIALKLLHGGYKLIVTLLYMASHFILSVPVLSASTIMLAIIILVTSGYSLKRLLQANAG